MSMPTITAQLRFQQGIAIVEVRDELPGRPPHVYTFSAPWSLAGELFVQGARWAVARVHEPDARAEREGR